MAFQPPPRETTILDDKKFSIFGNGGEKGRSRLFFGVTANGNPYAMVFTNDPQDPERGPIRAAMDPVIWGVFVNTCRTVWNDPKAPNEIRIENKAGKPTAVFTDTVTVVGKDEKGVCYLAILKKGRPSKRFNILPTIYMNLVDREGNQIPEGLQSSIFAPGWLDRLDYHVCELVKTNYKPFEKDGPAKGSSYNKPAGKPAGDSGGGYNGSDFDDDIPF